MSAVLSGHPSVAALLARVSLVIVDEVHVLHEYHDSIFEAIPSVPVILR
jgi:replicative superfamily II helicase